MYNIMLTEIDILGNNVRTLMLKNVTKEHRDYKYHEEIGTATTTSEFSNSGLEIKEIGTFKIISGSANHSCTVFTWIEWKAE
jgi:hypothetical protein